MFTLCARRVAAAAVSGLKYLKYNFLCHESYSPVWRKNGEERGRPEPSARWPEFRPTAAGRIHGTAGERHRTPTPVDSAGPGIALFISSILGIIAHLPHLAASQVKL